MDVTEQLKRAVQALAQPAHIQIELFPNFVAVGDELAIDFSEALEAFVVSGALHLKRHQSAAVTRLDAELARWSGPAHAEMWVNPDLLASDKRWESIRLGEALELTA